MRCVLLSSIWPPAVRSRPGRADGLCRRLSRLCRPRSGLCGSQPRCACAAIAVCDGWFPWYSPSARSAGEANIVISNVQAINAGKIRHCGSNANKIACMIFTRTVLAGASIDRSRSTRPRRAARRGRRTQVRPEICAFTTDRTSPGEIDSRRESSRRVSRIVFGRSPNWNSRNIPELGPWLRRSKSTSE